MAAQGGAMKKMFRHMHDAPPVRLVASSTPVRAAGNDNFVKGSQTTPLQMAGGVLADRASSNKGPGVEGWIEDKALLFDASLKAVYDTFPMPVGLIDRSGRYIVVNTAYAAIHELDPARLIGNRIENFVPGALAQLRQDLAVLDAGLRVADREIVWKERVFHELIQPVRNSDGQVMALTSTLVDITSRKQAERILEKNHRRWQFHASHDHLTGLPNRRHMDEAIDQQLRRAVQDTTPLSVLMIDVDMFKDYNDHVGHLQGDECLRSVARQLRQVMRRSSDVMGRYGGEEFMAVLPGTGAAHGLRIALNALQEVRNLQLAHPTSPFGCVTLSIGVATFDDFSRKASVAQQRSELIGQADRALYDAKAQGRNTVCSHPAA
jgi:diguanylate cyclase (GGDEF)-like protein/PAS domain S-box-containing protein